MFHLTTYERYDSALSGKFNEFVTFARVSSARHFCNPSDDRQADMYSSKLACSP